MAISTLIYYIGLMTCTTLLYKFIDFTLLHFLRPASSLDRYKASPEHWALITGASDGIGYGFAQELVQRGFKVILLARNRTKLEECQQKLALECPSAETKILVVDAIKSSASDLEHAVSTISSLNITVLINNVGGLPLRAQPYFKPVSAYTTAEIDDTMDINNRFLARTTSIMLPVLSRTTRRSLIINISSGSEIGIPWLIIYSATKGFVNAFSRSLARECHMEGLPIDVLNITPGDVQSNSQKIPTSLLCPTSRAFARDTMDKVGWAVMRGMIDLRPYILHDLMLGIFGLLPERVRSNALENELQSKKATYDKSQEGSGKHKGESGSEGKKNL